jgi:hypothetical protein
MEKLKLYMKMVIFFKENFKMDKNKVKELLKEKIFKWKLII